ncbi:hypothetical protein [Caballeronia sp. RCC_10]|uniref:hypothetical protein n=1 Tax=Caballeronia sp. RCC_10 TaxID=3239227 RepID=UPI003526110C
MISMSPTTDRLSLSISTGLASRDEVPIDASAVDVPRDYHDARRSNQWMTQWLFIATAAKKPMQTDTMLKFARAALRRTGFDATDESPRLLRNTYSRRRIVAGKTNEEMNDLMGLSSHRTATRLRQTVEGA